GPEVGRKCAPLGAVLMSPDDRRDGAPQILRLRLTLGPTRLNQRLQAHPVCVRQHCPLLIPGGAKRPSSQSVQARTGPSIANPAPRINVRRTPATTAPAHPYWPI